MYYIKCLSKKAKFRKFVERELFSPTVNCSYSISEADLDRNYMYKTAQKLPQIYSEFYSDAICSSRKYSHLLQGRDFV